MQERKFLTFKNSFQKNSKKTYWNGKNRFVTRHFGRSNGEKLGLTDSGNICFKSFDCVFFFLWKSICLLFYFEKLVLIFPICGQSWFQISVVHLPFFKIPYSKTPQYVENSISIYQATKYKSLVYNLKQCEWGIAKLLISTISPVYLVWQK